MRLVLFLQEKMYELLITFLLANPLLLQAPHIQETNSCSLSAVAECEYLLSWDLEEPWYWVSTVPNAMRQLGVNGRRISNRQWLDRLEKWIPTIIVLYKWQDKGFEITSWDIRIPHAVCWVWMVNWKIVGRFTEWQDVWVLGHFVIDKKAIDRYYSIHTR